MEGPLEKLKGGTIDVWEDRWFRLSESALEYFPNTVGAERAAISGRIFLQHIVNLVMHSIPSRELSFMVGGRKVSLRAVTADKASEWFRAIDTAERVHKHTRPAISDNTAELRRNLGSIADQPLDEDYAAGVTEGVSEGSSRSSTGSRRSSGDGAGSRRSSSQPRQSARGSFRPSGFSKPIDFSSALEEKERPQKGWTAENNNFSDSSDSSGFESLAYNQGNNTGLSPSPSGKSLESFAYKKGNNTGLSPSPPGKSLKSAASSRAPSAATSAASSREVSPAPNKYIDRLYSEHAQKLRRLSKLRKDDVAEEVERFAKASRTNMGVTNQNHSRLHHVDPRKVGQRLYEDARVLEDNRKRMRRYYETQERRSIEEGRRLARPTQCSAHPRANPIKTSDRLFKDALRRERDKEFAKHAWEEHEMEMMKSPLAQQRSRSTGGLTESWDRMYAEAQVRKVRLERKRSAVEKRQLEEIAKHSVGSGSAPASMQRVNELHDEHAARERKKACAVVLKNSREEQEIRMAAQQALGRRGTEPPIQPSSPPRWQRLANTKSAPNLLLGETVTLAAEELRLQEEKRRLRCEKDPASQADYFLNLIQAIIATRVMYVPPPHDTKDLVASLTTALSIYKEAHNDVKRDSGYLALCHMPSSRIFKEHLVPENEGRSRRLEPDPIYQVDSDFNVLLEAAWEAQELLKREIGGTEVAWQNQARRAHPAGVPGAVAAYSPGTKAPGAAYTKALALYGPAEGQDLRHRHLLDLARLHLEFKSCETLAAALEHLVCHFEVVDIRNYFNRPGLLGARFIEVLVLVHIGEATGKRRPHVCEIRLEHRHFLNARRVAEPAVREFSDKLQQVYKDSRVDVEILAYLAQSVLSRPRKGLRLRTFRYDMKSRFGSTIAGCRKLMAVGQRTLTFSQLREVCQDLHCGEHVTELWQELDSTYGSRISYWELDPQAVSLLLLFRKRLQAIVSMYEEGCDTEADLLFVAFTHHFKLCKVGQLDLHEFRQAVRMLGFSTSEADRLFSYLDRFGGPQCLQPAHVTVQDFSWLLRLGILVDADAVALQAVSLLLPFGAISTTWPPARKSASDSFSFSNATSEEGSSVPAQRLSDMITPGGPMAMGERTALRAEARKSLQDNWGPLHNQRSSVCNSSPRRSLTPRRGSQQRPRVSDEGPRPSRSLTPTRRGSSPSVEEEETF